VLSIKLFHNLDMVLVLAGDGGDVDILNPESGDCHQYLPLAWGVVVDNGL
jgi:hypothetical protein